MEYFQYINKASNGSLTPVLYYLGVTMAIIWLVINIICAISVYDYAGRYEKHVETKLVLLPKPLWIIASLFGGIFVGTCFYLLHFSTLNPLIKKQ
ncbi:MAG: hypothetical protein COA79_02120 [Planctomycetota bacterium]|nr:MAG: hypothetical protein COA79_02120 [Planctomycetota bacterium]